VSDALKPCPFCGGEPYERIVTDSYGEVTFIGHACGSVKVEMRSRTAQRMRDGSLEQMCSGIHEQWNTRAPQPPEQIADRIERMCAAFWDRHATLKWADCPESWKGFYRDNMREALKVLQDTSCPR
jgi:hypothetical protein